MSANSGLPLRAFRTLLVALPLAGLGACDWFTDFKNQPKLEPWEPPSQDVADTTHAPRGQPQYSVPVTGTQLAGYQVSYGALPGVVDSVGRAVTNPTPISPASLANGRKHYQINCAVCHGDEGYGNGPATRGYGVPGIGIGKGSNADTRYTDGYIYAMMRNGRGLMPTYNRIEEMDRWDVVNYLRALQGKVENSAGVGPVGYPGQNGATVPGYSATAPTRPAPFWRPPASAGGVARPSLTEPAPAGEVRTPAEAAGQTPAPGGASPAQPNTTSTPPSGTVTPSPSAAPAAPTPRGAGSAPAGGRS